ncbi:hypothetical protein CbuD7D7780_04000 [Coxiella burnetii]|nr:hypothetical protein CbuD7E6568_03980 [Coxiella burnetii]OYK82618.1 hypothetical protein CbuD7D7780_04000 [Coxiella burnetii]
MKKSLKFSLKNGPFMIRTNSRQFITRKNCLNNLLTLEGFVDDYDTPYTSLFVTFVLIDENCIFLTPEKEPLAQYTWISHQLLRL